MTSSNVNIYVTGPLCEEFTGIPLKKTSHAEFWCFFDLRRNKRLSKQSRLNNRDLRRHRAHYDVTAMQSNKNKLSLKISMYDLEMDATLRPDSLGFSFSQFIIY